MTLYKDCTDCSGTMIIQHGNFGGLTIKFWRCLVCNKYEDYEEKGNDEER